MPFPPLSRSARTAPALLVGSLLGLAGPVAAQDAPPSRPSVAFDSTGIVFRATDGVTRLTARFRVQQHLAATTEEESDYELAETQFAVRRMRLRLEGVLRDPRLRVNLQLSFARGDLDQENTGIANVLRDAYVTWQFTPSFAASVGQRKLPSNRQRLISSSELQSPDRSPVNAIFTADRDVGVFGTYTRKFGKVGVVARAAVSSGEGRNPAEGDDGLAYTGRIEVLPFGSFAQEGDYTEGDLAREPAPKLSLGVAATRNDRGVRTGGQLGPRLFAARSANTYYADLMFKQRGVMLAAEYAHRIADDPVTRRDTATRYVYTGAGYNVRASWLLPGSSFEPQLRYTRILPALAIRGQRSAERIDERGVGLARYVNGHRIKTNGELLHTRFRDLARARTRGEWMLRLGLEVGI